MIFERPISKSEVPGFRELNDEMDFGWIDTYQKRQKIKAEIREINAELQRLNKLDPANEDVLKNALADLPILREEIIKRGSIHLDINRRAANPFSSRLERLDDFIWALLIPENIDIMENNVKAMAALMPTRDNCAPVAEKRKKISSLQKQVEKKKSKLEKCSPPEHFLWQNGQPTKDLCMAYEKKWRSVQGRFNGPANVQGFDLGDCKGSEQNAWRDLGIRSAMSPTSKSAPIPRKA